jgi:restriction system protein
MPIPTYQELYPYILKLLANGKILSMKQLREALAKELKLSNADLEELLPSARQRVWDSRVGWAKTYLVKAQLVAQPARGCAQITERGLKVLAEKPKLIDDKYLTRFAEFVEFYGPSHSDKEQSQNQSNELQAVRTPEELMESAYQTLRQQLEAEMLERILNCSTSFFEQLVVDLLLRMGYGGSRRDAGQAIGQSGDGGIDGIIKEDRLGLDTIYLQAKRWTGSVGRPDVQKFAGALQGHRAKKGVMITTSTFTKEAQEYAAAVETKIVLIDGKRLTKLMFDFGLGCSTQSTFELKKIDSDYFDPDYANG